MNVQVFSINGMTCEACTKLVAKRVKTIDGIVEANVTLSSQTAELTCARPISLAEVATALSDTHYQAKEA